MSASHQIIGICGRKFNGKDTIADYLVKNYGFTKISIGDPLKHALQQVFSFSDEQLWGSQKETVDEFWNVTPRNMMQYFGTECFRVKFGNDFPHIGDNIWTMALHRKIESMLAHGTNKIVIPDLRFPNEEVPIRDFNGTVIKVIRDNFPSHDTHVSENSLSAINADYVIHNDTFEQLYRDVDATMRLL